jgi:4-hydroxy-3-polyprenylbenzoate decarboxylase
VAAVTDANAYVNEAEVAGGLRKEPVALVKCETNDLYVPASSEIVIEGRVFPNQRCEEGPHGEYTGYRVSERSNRERLLVRVEAITFRNNPVLPMSCMGMPVDDSHSTASLTQSAALLQEVRSRGVTVKGLFVPPWGPWGGVIVSLKKPHAPILHQIASTIWAHPVGRAVHYVIFLEETADPYDPASVLHEIFYRCHPIRGLKKIEDATAGALDPCLTAHERHYKMGASAIIDCTAPVDWPFPPIESRFTNPLLYPKEIQERVLSRWQEFGFE